MGCRAWNRARGTVTGAYWLLRFHPTPKKQRPGPHSQHIYPETNKYHKTKCLNPGAMQGPAEWEGRYYVYRVRVFSHWSGAVEDFEVTDPYSLSLAADGARTQVRGWGFGL